LRVERRTTRDWTRNAVWLLAAVFFVVGVALRSPAEAVLGLALGAGLILLTRRRKAAPARDAVYTASADRLLADGTQQPGQLSLTATSLVWTPSRFASRRGARAFTAEGADLRSVGLRRGPGLAGVVLEVAPAAGGEVALLTRSSRRLEAELDRRSGA
jgi:hypothetical protein